jgi:hypothetical protein
MRLRSFCSLHSLACGLLALSACADGYTHPSPGDAGAELDGNTSPNDATVGDDAHVDASNPDLDASPAADAGDEDSGIAPDGCNGISELGRCLDEKTVERCVTTSGGNVPPFVTTQVCRSDEQCRQDVSGATCLATGPCRQGATECVDASILRTCNAGAWQEASCATGCSTHALGAQCKSDLAIMNLSGSLAYEAREPNQDSTDWTTTLSSRAARRVIAASYRGTTLIDATQTGEDGAFTLVVPQEIGVDDSLAFILLGVDERGVERFVVANPGFEASSTVRDTFDTFPDPSVWSFTFALAEVANGDALVIPQQLGSGAVHIFQTLDAAYRVASDHYKQALEPTVAVWMGIGTRWDCGACAATFSVPLLDTSFRHQVWLDGSSNEGHWSDAVTAHELGHFVMAAYGYPLAEYGPHFVAAPTNPGQAWSEGFATFFSSMVRGSPRYFDKQKDAFFWFDLHARSYSLMNQTWTRPLAHLGLTQLIDENDVAAMALSAFEVIGAKEPFLDALASPRLRVPPFERGYFKREWGDPSHPEIFETTDEPLPYLADFFDALRCEDALTAAQLDEITIPETYYPYPSGSPLCR